MVRSNTAPISVRNGHFAKSPMGATMSDQETLLTPSEVAALFRVDPKTVTRWAKAGKLTSIRTLGGHRRYKESEVTALLKSIPGNSAGN
jgi:excisionase family DNA binding protein